MYPTTDAYRAAMRETVRTDRVTGTLTLPDGTALALSAADLMSGSLTIDNQCVTGEELEFGCAYLGQASFRLRTAMSRYKLYGAVLRLTYGVLLPDESWFDVPLGVYTVAEAERGSVYVALKCYDNILALQKTYDGTVLQGTPYKILGRIAEACGLEQGQTEDELLALHPNAAENCQLDASYGCATWRDCAAAVAQLLAGFVTADRQGRLVVRGFAAQPDLSLGVGARSTASVSDFACHYCALTVTSGDDAYTAAGEQGDTGLSMTMTDPPLWQSGLPSKLQSRTDAVFETLAALDYTPAEVTMPGDPSIDCGDRIALPDAAGADGDDAPEMLVTHVVWKYHGQATLKSVGCNPHLTGTDSRTQRALRQLQSSTQADKVVFYHFRNLDRLELTDGAKPETGALLDFATKAEGSALLLAQLVLEAAPTARETVLPVLGTDGDETQIGTVTLAGEAEMTLTAAYYLDGYAQTNPPQQRLAAGMNTLALVRLLTDLPAQSSHELSIRLSVEGGTATVEKSGLRAVLIGQGMAGSEAWDGRITAEELAAAVTLTRRYGGIAPTDEVLAAVQTPTGLSPQETAAAVRLVRAYAPAGFAEDGPLVQCPAPEAEDE